MIKEINPSVLLCTPEWAATLFLLSSEDLNWIGNEDTQFPAPDSLKRVIYKFGAQYWIQWLDNVAVLLKMWLKKA